MHFWESLNTVCHGCMSSDRLLSTARNYSNLFYELLSLKCSEDVKAFRNVWGKPPLLCWECLGTLHKIDKFKNKAQKTQSVLSLLCSNKEKLHPIYTESQSTMKLSLKSTYDLDIKFEDDKDNISTNNIFKNELEINVLQEYLNENTEMPELKQELDCEDIDIKQESDDDRDMLTNDYHEGSIKDVKAECLKENIKKKPTRMIKIKYDMITMSENELKEFKLILNLNADDVKSHFESKRASYESQNYKYRCDSCGKGFQHNDSYMKHKRKYHHVKLQYTCDFCKTRFKNKKKLGRHINAHLRLYKCTLCEVEFKNEDKLDEHFKNHPKVYHCLKCGYKTGKRLALYKHDNKMHKRFICDYCGNSRMTKESLIKHIKSQHAPCLCPYCGKVCKYKRYLKYHIEVKHTYHKSDDTFCVECNRSFDNIQLYKRHLMNSVAHNPRTKTTVPCPECGKVYAKKSFMTNHYAMVHQKRTKYFCQICVRYFLNSSRLRNHTQTAHLKIKAPKNKICVYCGRGFAAERTLTNHIRTHTGERPFECTFCTAKFAQKSALVTHNKNIHKYKLTYAEIAQTPIQNRLES